jgi:diguanylate cyclase (GGDEF)-like protein
MADPIPRLVAASDQARVADNIRRRIEGEANDIRYAFKGIRKDGREVDVEVHGKAVEFDGRPAVAGVALDVTEQKAAQQQLNYLAYYDVLTKLPNRTLFMDHLNLAIAGANRHGTLMALLFLDLDHFKEINDTLGHPIGDLLLQETAQRLSFCVRDTDTVARMGGDEFAIVQTDLAGLEGAEILAQKLVEAISQPFLLDGNEVYTSTSIGLTIYPLEEVGPEQLLKNADMAMYAAKAKGRNNFQFFSPAMNVEAHKHRDLQTGLRQALERGELMLYYQPKVNLQSGEIVGAEALLRWCHPERGLIPPLEFIPVAEESGLIVPIGEWVLKQSCGQIKSWQRAGLPALRVSVNLSAAQFKRDNLLETLSAALRDADLEPQYLELEITESLLMQTAHDTVNILEWLRCFGIHVSIDDFGTGYSSLSYLKRLPVDILKIDRSFIDEIPDDGDDIAITKAIISLSHHLNLSVIAEGVETRAQVDFLRANGCDEVQGYYFSKPLPAEEFEALLRSGGRFEI